MTTPINPRNTEPAFVRALRWIKNRTTIRSRILLACLAISTITAALGGYASIGIRHAGDMVVKTFD